MEVLNDQEYHMECLKESEVYSGFNLPSDALFYFHFLLIPFLLLLTVVCGGFLQVYTSKA